MNIYQDFLTVEIGASDNKEGYTQSLTTCHSPVQTLSEALKQLKELKKKYPDRKYVVIECYNERD